MPSGNHPHSIKPSFMMKRRAGPLSPPPPLLHSLNFKYMSMYCVLYGGRWGGRGGRTAAQSALKIKQIKNIKIMKPTSPSHKYLN